MDDTVFHTHEVVRRKDGWKFQFHVPAHFSKLRFVHAGVQGVTVTAHDLEQNKTVAIKKVACNINTENSVRRAYEDLSMLAALKHPNIIPFLAAFAPDSTLSEIYLVMEHYPFTLHQISVKLKLKHPALSLLISQCLSGVSYLHRIGIVHGDLKPSNIVVNEEYQLRILDPGLTRLIWDQESRLSQFTTDWRYRAPEVLLGLHFDGKADVWSIGCIFAQLIRRESMFTLDNMPESWRALFTLHLSSFQYESTESYMSILQSEISTEMLFPDDLFDQDSEVPDQHVTAFHARQMISRMLVVNPTERYSSIEARRDPYVLPWFKEDDEDVNYLATNALQEYGDRSLEQWKGLICNLLATIGKDPSTETDESYTLSEAPGTILPAERTISHSSTEFQNSPDSAASDEPIMSPSNTFISSRKRRLFHRSRFYQIPTHIISC